MSDIGSVGVLCLQCDWRNTGASRDCRHCGQLLVPSHALDSAEVRIWVEDQAIERSKKGLPSSPGMKSILADWASPGYKWDSAVDGPGVDVDFDAAVDGDSEVTSGGAVKAVCPSCEAEYSDAVKFCSECGTETVVPDAAAQIDQLQDSIRALSLRLRELEAPHEVATAPKFSWMDVPVSEKWKVTWGIFGRTILINLGLWAAMILLLLVLGVLAAAGG